MSRLMTSWTIPKMLSRSWVTEFTVLRKPFKKRASKVAKYMSSFLGSWRNKCKIWKRDLPCLDWRGCLRWILFGFLSIHNNFYFYVRFFILKFIFVCVIAGLILLMLNVVSVIYFTLFYFSSVFKLLVDICFCLLKGAKYP